MRNQKNVVETSNYARVQSGNVVVTSNYAGAQSGNIDMASNLQRTVIVPTIDYDHNGRASKAKVLQIVQLQVLLKKQME